VAKCANVSGGCLYWKKQCHCREILTSRRTTNDCPLPHRSLQCEFPRCDVMWLLQREKKTLQALVAFRAVLRVPGLPSLHARLPLQRSEAAKEILARVHNKRQCVRVSVASPVKVSRTEIFVISSPQKHKPLPAELVEERRKGRDDQRVQFRSSSGACGRFCCVGTA
jgi:hypothetical protein